jgi:hypothetical protein
MKLKSSIDWRSMCLISYILPQSEGSRQNIWN